MNIDDTWEGTRDANGDLHTNHKFPDMKALADYVHSKGLKLGIYSGPGPRTCGGYPASYGHEEQDAKMYAEWGIDYLKYDWCSAGTIYKNDALQPVYQKMGEALESNRPAHRLQPVRIRHGRRGEVGRQGGRQPMADHRRHPRRVGQHDGQHREAGEDRSFAGPGHWNDPDMLEIGNGHMSD